MLAMNVGDRNGHRVVFRSRDGMRIAPNGRPWINRSKIKRPSGLSARQSIKACLTSPRCLIFTRDGALPLVSRICWSSLRCTNTVEGEPSRFNGIAIWQVISTSNGWSLE